MASMHVVKLVVSTVQEVPQQPLTWKKGTDNSNGAKHLERTQRSSAEHLGLDQ